MKKYFVKNAFEPADCLVIFVPESKSKKAALDGLPASLRASVENILASGDFSARPLELFFGFDASEKPGRYLLVGTGGEKELSIQKVKRMVGTAVVAIQQKKCHTITLHIPESWCKQFGAHTLGSTLAIAMDTAEYAFDDYKKAENKVMRLDAVNLVVPKASMREFEKGVAEGITIAGAVNQVRKLGNTPPSHMTPTVLAKVAEDLSKRLPAVKTTVLSRAEMKKLGMGCLLGVAQGSHEEPKFIILEYRGGQKTEKPVVLVGKGITFDSGGLSLKPWDMMIDMKYDMLGAATVLGTIQAAAELKLKKNIVGLMPTTENMPGGGAYRPDDILTAMNGMTVEIGNTDAEGRLILADALSYAKQFDPKAVIDLATLTGACVVALGTERSGLFFDHEALGKKLLASAEVVGEALWRLPLGEEFSEAVKSEVADVKNVGGGRYGGASAAAAFLQYFTDYPWAHIDLSSAYSGSKGKPWIRAGANGFGVETLIEYLRH